MEGNYGELVLQKSINKFIEKVPAVRKLNHKVDDIARQGYELTDFYLKLNDVIVGIDAKHYMSLRSQFVNTLEDHNWTFRFKKKLQRTQETLECLFSNETVRCVAVNAARNENPIKTIKPIGVNCYFLNRNSDVDLTASYLGDLITTRGVK